MRAIIVIAIVAGCSAKAPNHGNRDPWSTVKIGSVFESRAVTRMERPFARVTETTTKQTLIARTSSEASVKIEIVEGEKSSAQNVTISLRRDAAMPPHDGSTVTTTDETCTVPAGTFDCTRTTVEIRQGDATRSSVTWRAKAIPVPIKSVVTNENMTITTELTSLAI